MKPKYENLKDFLMLGVDEQVLTFSQLETITGAPISPDYLNRKTFKWTSSRFYMAARDAGFEIEDVDYTRHYLIFKRSVPTLTVAAPTPMATAPVMAAPAAIPPGVMHQLSLRPIAEELRLYHGVTLNPTHGLVDITRSNADIIEPLIPHRLRSTVTGDLLSKSYHPNAKNLFDRIKAHNGGAFPFRSRDDVLAVVEQINIDNGTNDAKYHDSQAINLITDFIVDAHNGFEHRIDGRPGLAPALVDEIRALINAAGFIDRKGKPYCPRSLPSKVCKYFSEYEYPTADAFYIDDAVVRECLRHYLRLYNGIRLTKQQIDSSLYSELFDWLSQLHTFDPSITKSELDHILWYPHKKKS